MISELILTASDIPFKAILNSECLKNLRHSRQNFPIFLSFVSLNDYADETI